MDALDDDLVTSLLVKDAKDSSLKYSSMGLDAYKSSRPPTNKPKPNTRFLRNIIKDTDSHNAALLAKEAAEARARLHSLTGTGPAGNQKKIGTGDIRKRQLGDIAAILNGRPSKRKKTENLRRSSTAGKPLKEEEEMESKSVRGKSRMRSRDEEDGEKFGESRKRRPRDEEGREDKPKESSKRRRREAEEEDGDRSHKRHKRQHREDVSEERESKEERKRRHRKYRRSASPELRRESRKPEKIIQKQERDEDSDPLEEIIGPLPRSTAPLRIRGRGAISMGTTLDTRFSSSYDPSIDIQPDFDPAEENDWDQALEALRDRQKWQKKGADRLRAAGFTEEEIEKWEKGGKGGKEKCEEDVKWSKRGERREWDKGKVVDEDGTVKIEASWGRLKESI